jgi:hypothetical protein
MPASELYVKASWTYVTSRAKLFNLVGIYSLGFKTRGKL